jgi:phosphoribosylanthranilate isomerase
VRLGAVQLHGDETPEYAAAVHGPVIKAVSFGEADNLRVGAWAAGTTLLLDAHDPVKRGGTGQTVDWAAAATLAAHRKILLAGGLTPDNVMEAVSQVRPFGIDVSSGVECTPGVKDHQRMRALFEVLRAATAGREGLPSSARL